jgi:hypothetical protein
MNHSHILPSFFLPFAVDWKPWDCCLQHLWKMDTKSTDLVYCCTSQLRTSINFEYDEWCIAQTVCELRTWKENSSCWCFECLHKYLCVKTWIHFTLNLSYSSCFWNCNRNSGMQIE